MYRNKLTSILRAAKDKSYKDHLQATQGNPRSHWKSINSILGRNTNINNKAIALKPFCSDIANKFNEHFLKTDEREQTNVHNEDHTRFLQNSPSFSMYLTRK